MAASYNRVILLGNCGRDPEVRYMPSGKPVANITIATSNRWKDRETGEDREDTQWHRVTFYEGQAEIVGRYVKKGTSLLVEGELKYGKFTDKDGIERYTTDIIARSLQLVGTPSGGRQNGDRGGDDGFGDGDGGGYGGDSAPARGHSNQGGNRPQGNSNPPQQRSNGGYPASGAAPRGNNAGNQGNGGYSSNGQAPRGGGGGGGYSGGNAPQGRGPAPQQNRGPANTSQRPQMGGNGGFPNDGDDSEIPF